MDWSEIVRLLLGGSVGALITNYVKDRSTTRLAIAERQSRELLSRQDRTYDDTKTAFMDALSLLVRLDQDVVVDVPDDPAASYATPAILGAIEARLRVFGSTEAAETFRTAADRLCSSWDDERTTERFEQIEQNFYKENQEHFWDHPSMHETLKDMKQRRYKVANRGAESYSTGADAMQRLTQLAQDRLALDSESDGR